MSDAEKRRVDLWLRSERALGLGAVPVSRLKSMHAAAARAGKVSGRQAPARPAAGGAATGGSATGRPVTGRPIVAQPVAARQAAALPQAAAPAGKADAALFAGAASAGAAAFESPVLGRAEKIAALEAMDRDEVKGCVLCRLCKTRTHTVFGEGDPDAKIFFIGEGPGQTEDETGRPFVGRAGQLLNKMIGGMGLRREDVFIANIVKCRPPDNRVPAPDEVATCTPYLVRQLEIIRSGVIVTLGLPSAKYMLETKLSMGRLRGQWQNWRGIKLMPTFHPAYLLRAYTDENRAMVWSDLKAVMLEVGLPIPAGRG